MAKKFKKRKEKWKEFYLGSIGRYRWVRNENPAKHRNKKEWTPRTWWEINLTCVKSNVAHKGTQILLTLEQHRFELGGSTYTWIFFNKYHTCIFVLLIFTYRRGKVCVRLESPICGITRARVWVLILSGLFQLPALGWVIYQFLCFWGSESRMWIFDCAGGQCC